MSIPTMKVKRKRDNLIVVINSSDYNDQDYDENLESPQEDSKVLESSESSENLESFQEDLEYQSQTQVAPVRRTRRTNSSL